MDVRGTGSPYADVVEPPNSKIQRLPRDLEYTTVSDEAEDKKTDAVDAGDGYGPQCHEVDIAEMAFYASPHTKWPNTDYYNLRNPEPAATRDISIDAMTETYATVQMPAQIEPN